MTTTQANLVAWASKVDFSAALEKCKRFCFARRRMANYIDYYFSDGSVARFTGREITERVGA